MDRKKSTENALRRYLEKQIQKDEPKPEKTKRHNKKPEKQVEKECLEWMKQQGWAVQIYESKATFSPKQNRWVNQSMKAGNADCQGVLPNGRAVAIEFKAPGKLSTFNRPTNQRQKDFMIERIHMNAFAAVVDSLERLKNIYTAWVELEPSGTITQQKYLLEQLPQSSQSTKNLWRKEEDFNIA